MSRRLIRNRVDHLPADYLGSGAVREQLEEHLRDRFTSPIERGRGRVARQRDGASNESSAKSGARGASDYRSGSRTGAHRPRVARRRGAAPRLVFDRAGHPQAAAPRRPSAGARRAAGLSKRARPRCICDRCPTSCTLSLEHLGLVDALRRRCEEVSAESGVTASRTEWDRCVVAFSPRNVRTATRSGRSARVELLARTAACVTRWAGI